MKRLGVALVIALLGGVARADGIAVEAQGCDLRTDELERLVRLELTSVISASDPSDYRVTLRCGEGDIQIRIDDPLTGKSVERSVISPPPEQPEPERLLALAVAQLYRASWLELAAKDEPPLPPAHPVEHHAAALEHARALVRPILVDEPAHPPSWSLGLGGGARLRHLSAPLALPRISTQVAFWPTARSWVFLGAGLEWASPSRGDASVDVLLIHGGGGFGIEPLSSGDWAGFAELAAGFSYTRIAGDDVPAGFTADVASGGGFDGSLALGVAWTPQPIRVELLGLVGLLAGSPSGLVSGDDPVALDGALIGLDLRIRWLL